MKSLKAYIETLTKDLPRAGQNFRNLPPPDTIERLEWITGFFYINQKIIVSLELSENSSELFMK